MLNHLAIQADRKADMFSGQCLEAMDIPPEEVSGNTPEGISNWYRLRAKDWRQRAQKIRRIMARKQKSQSKVMAVR